MKHRLRIDTHPQLWLQVVALILGGCLLLACQDRPVYLAGLGLFTAVGIIGLVRCVLRPASVSVWDVLMVSLCLGYGLGSLNTEITWVRGPLDYLSLTWARPTAIAQTTGWMMLACAVLGMASSVDRTRILKDLRIAPEHRILVVPLVAGVTALTLAQVLLGNIGYHADIGDGGSNISPLASITVSAICPVATLASFSWRDQRGWQRWLMLVCVVALMMVQAFQGRRVFIYSLVVCLMGFFAARPPKRILSPANLLAFGLAAVLAMSASKAFFALRLASVELGGSKDTGALVHRGMDILLNAQRTSLDAEVRDNQSSRTFIVSYLAELVQSLETREPMYGEVLLFDVALNVPTSLWPDKYKVTSIGAEEALANPHFGFRVADEANSIVTTGASDFGIPGIFVYPAVLAALYSLLLRFTRRWGALAQLLVTAALVNTLLNVEAATVDYFGTVRGIAIVAMGVWSLVQAYHLLGPHQRGTTA